MVMASGRWLGVRMEVITSLLIGIVALAAVLASQDAGKYNHNHAVLCIMVEEYFWVFSVCKYKKYARKRKT